MSTRSVPSAGRISARTIQVGLGVIWLLDGLLQLQPRMFGPDFANQVILPTAQGQPGPVVSVITHAAHLIALQPALTNTVFAGVQILIGLGLLIRETVRPALALSFVWASVCGPSVKASACCFTGMASPLTGAPGGALLYAAIGLLVWPRLGANARGPGDGGSGGRRRAAGRAWRQGRLDDHLERHGDPLAAAGQPGRGERVWCDQRCGHRRAELAAHLQLSVAHAVGSGGLGLAVAGAALSFVIGLGPLISRHTTVFLTLGAALALDFWVFGEAFGEPFSGIATDPNTGPLLILLALTLYPNRRQRARASGATRRGQAAERQPSLS